MDWEGIATLVAVILSLIAAIVVPIVNSQNKRKEREQETQLKQFEIENERRFEKIEYDSWVKHEKEKAVLSSVSEV